MSLVSLFLITMVVFKAFLIINIIRLMIMSKEPPKRAKSIVRNKFKSVQDVKEFQDWRDYIKASLIEIEIQKIIDDEDHKTYYTL